MTSGSKQLRLTSHGSDRTKHLSQVRRGRHHWAPATPSTVVRTIFFTVRLL